MSALRPVSAADARRLLAEGLGITAPEEIALEAAGGRVLARALVAGEDLPAFPRSAMDGFAVRSADVAGAPVSLSMAGTVAVGERPALALGPGEAMAIPTGGHLPDGADAVVMVEQTRLEGAVVTVLASVDAGRHVVAPGEDVPRGRMVLAAGQLLGPPQVAALAAFGQTRPLVHRRPRVAVLSTGSEVRPLTPPPPPGQVRDVNQYALAAGALAAGCQVTHAGLVTDDPAALAAQVRALAAGHDVVLVSGGTSVGGRDHTAEVLAELGVLLFHGINVRPGRPTAGARLDGTLVVALPGVPAAALIIFAVFVRPLLERLSGRPGPRLAHRARLTTRHQSEPGREDYLRVRLAGSTAESVAGPTSSLTSLLAADGLVIIPAETTVMEPGTEVDVWPWP